MANHPGGGAGPRPPRRRLLAVQLILAAAVVLSAEVDGGKFDGITTLTKSVGRSIARAPSKVMDGGQYVTQKVAGGLGNAVQPVGLKGLVDATGGAVSNVLGTTSRLIGKPAVEPKRVRFLYSRPLGYLGTSQYYQDAIAMVLSHALANLMLYKDDMAVGPKDDRDKDKDDRDEGEDEGKRPVRATVARTALPVLGRAVNKLRRAGASEDDLCDIVYLMGRNGKVDIPEELGPKILGTLKDQFGKFKTWGLIDEIRWIARRPNGFHRLNEKEMNDYKMHTIYQKYTVLYPPQSEDTTGA